MYSTLLTSKKSYFFFTANSLQTLYAVNIYSESVSKRQAVCFISFDATHRRLHYIISVEGSTDDDDDEEEEEEG